MKAKKKDMSTSQKIIQLHASQKKRSKKRKGFSSFFSEMKAEMKRVSWTTREELRQCTKIVILSILFLGMGIYVIDLVIRFFLNGVGSIVHWIGG